MQDGSVLCFSFDELTALCVALQEQLGHVERLALTPEGRAAKEALLQRLEELWNWAEDLRAAAANDACAFFEASEVPS